MFHVKPLYSGASRPVSYIVCVCPLDAHTSTVCCVSLLFHNDLTNTMTHTVAIANQKGGVGKTTTAVNLAASLAIAERRTLLLDADPQGNATSGVGIAKHELQISLYDALVEGRPAREVVLPVPGLPFLSVVPATQDLVGAELQLVEREGPRSRVAARARAVRGRIRLHRRRLPALAGTADAQRARRRAGAHHSHSVRVLRTRGNLPAAQHRPPGAAELQSRTRDQRRAAHDVRQSAQPLPSGRGGRQGIFRGQGVRHADPPKRSPRRGAQLRQADPAL